MVEMQMAGGQSKVNLSEEVFGVPYKEALVHQVVVAYRAGARSGTRRTKSRSDVRGGGSKPWRQKGTGRARAGTRSSPLWRGGGMTFAARPHDYTQKVNKRMYRAAMRSVLSQLVRDGKLSVVEEFALEQPRTRIAIERLQELGLNGSETVMLVYGADVPEATALAVRNLPWIMVTTAPWLNPYDLLLPGRVVLTDKARQVVEQWLSS